MHDGGGNVKAGSNTVQLETQLSKLNRMIEVMRSDIVRKMPGRWIGLVLPGKKPRPPIKNNRR
jgi:hypothetical protein